MGLRIAVVGGVWSLAISGGEAAAEQQSDLEVLLSRPAKIPSEARPPGKVVLLNITSAACPSLCVQQMLDLQAIIEQMPPEMAADVQIVSLGSDPQQDSADRLTAFATSLNLDLQHWSLIGADPEFVARYWRELGLPQASDAKEPPTAIFLFGSAGNFAQRFDGTPIDRPRLVREIVALRRFEQANRVSTTH